MEWPEQIVLDPAILDGKPLVKGTRLAVEFILDLLAQGWSEGDILANYPGLTTEDIRACLAYACALLRVEKAYLLRARDSRLPRSDSMSSEIDALRLDDELLAVIQRDPKAVADTTAGKRLVANGRDQSGEGAEGADTNSAMVGRGQHAGPISEEPAAISRRTLLSGDQRRGHGEVAVKTCIQKGFEILAVLAYSHANR
jgi:uncharacterized protein (DUF433 family)